MSFHGCKDTEKSREHIVRKGKYQYFCKELRYNLEEKAKMPELWNNEPYHYKHNADRRKNQVGRYPTSGNTLTNFVNTQRTTRRKLPFGVCQIGKSFRNEITPGNFIFRVREFEQMELEFFCKPGTDLEWFQYWRTFCHNWLLGIGRAHV